MINQFPAFAGSLLTVLFRSHGSDIDAARIQLHGRPSEWRTDPSHSQRTNPSLPRDNAEVFRLESAQATDYRFDSRTVMAFRAAAFLLGLGFVFDLPLAFASAPENSYAS